MRKHRRLLRRHQPRSADQRHSPLLFRFRRRRVYQKSSYMYYSDQALQKNGHKIIRMAQEEDLEAHANAVRIRVHDASENQDEIEREEGE
nr:histidinol dehydrogenase [Allobaculum sp. Allo2]